MSTLPQNTIWNPTAVRHGRLSMIVLVIAVTLEDGTAAETSTWAIGASEKLALSAWRRSYPDMATRLKSHRVVTDPSRPVVKYVNFNRPDRGKVAGYRHQ